MAGAMLSTQRVKHRNGLCGCLSDHVQPHRPHSSTKAVQPPRPSALLPPSRAPTSYATAYALGITGNAYFYNKETKERAWEKPVLVHTYFPVHMPLLVSPTPDTKQCPQES